MKKHSLTELFGARNLLALDYSEIDFYEKTKILENREKKKFEKVTVVPKGSKKHLKIGCSNQRFFIFPLTPYF